LIPSPAPEEDIEVAQAEAGEVLEEVPGEAPANPPGTLAFFNGLGGFTEDGREYVIRLDPGMVTPVLWSNVIANTSFWTVI
jgi:cyclic beta-1,2-glucan synthetase